MNKLKLSVVLLSSCLFLIACGEEEQTQSNNNPVPPPQPIPEVEIDTTPETPSDNTGNVSGLIPSTNPQVRLKQVNQGKGDPFGVIRPPQVVQIASNQGLSPTAQDRFKNNAILIREPVVTGQPNNNARRPNNNAGRPNNNAGRPNSGGNNRPNPVETTPSTVLVRRTPAGQVPTNTQNRTNTGGGGDTQIAARTTSSTGGDLGQGMNLPQLPRTEEAQGIQISGIMDLQGQNVALVTTPWDGTTRSVRVGDVISDSTGSINVKVKQISFDSATDIALEESSGTVFRSINDADGIVILEQNGADVTRKVTENVGNSDEASTDS